MRRNTFFVCANCGNSKNFKVFMSYVQIIPQSPELGILLAESGVLPNLRQYDNFFECQACFTTSEYDAAIDLGRKFIENALASGLRIV